MNSCFYRHIMRYSRRIHVLFASFIFHFFVVYDSIYVFKSWQL